MFRKARRDGCTVGFIHFGENAIQVNFFLPGYTTEGAQDKDPLAEVEQLNQKVKGALKAIVERFVKANY